MKLQNVVLFGSSFSLVEKSILTRHLSIMLKAGVPLSESILTLAEQDRNHQHQRILRSIYDTVERGMPLSKALAQTKEFDVFYVSLIEVGESSGTLVESLSFLSGHLTKEHILKQKITSASLYPAIVFAALFILSMGISLFLLPQLVVFFESFEEQLPLNTVILLAVANFMKNYGVIFFSSCFAMFVGGLFFLNLSKIKPYWHRTVLRIPLFGHIMSLYQQARFARNMGILLKSGVPIAAALDATTRTLSNLAFRDYVATLTKSMLQGKTITQVLAKHHFAHFSPILQRMIIIGEKSGKLPDTLEYVGTFFEEEIEYAQKNMTNLLEPVLLLVIGFLVGFVALAIIGPIYQLTGSLGA